MAQKYGTNPPPPSGRRPSPPPNPPASCERSGAPVWNDARMRTPKRDGVYWCAFENGGVWTATWHHGRWHADSGACADMGAVELWMELPEHPQRDERAATWRNRLERMPT